MTTLPPRVETLLRRFPAHLDLADPAKTFAAVATSLASELEVSTSAVGRIRRNHRILDVDNAWDLLALVGLHDFDDDHFDVLERRLDAAGDAGRALLLAPSDDDLAGETRGRLLDLVGIAGEVFPAFDGEPDEMLANQRLANALTRITFSTSEMRLRRAQALDAIGIHQVGNASIASILGASAAMLALDVLEILHHEERYWHFARCADRLRVVEPQAPGSESASIELEPVPDVVALEENPLRPADVSPAPRPHGRVFSITRAGWEDVPVTVRVLGIADRCAAPIVVNVDTGSGVAYTQTVAEGDEVRFETTGIVTLGPVGAADPDDVTRNAFSFTGAVFASSHGHSRDFVWADASDPSADGDRAATFVRTAPIADGFDPSAVFPRPGGLIDPPTLLVNTTRWALFVRAAHFGRHPDGGADEAAVPSPLAGFWDRSVFEPTASDGTQQPPGLVGFEWQEREAFAVRVWLPRRFEALDVDGEIPIRERIRILLDRFRGAGIHVHVSYADDRWTLGVGLARTLESIDPMGTIVAGTTLWPAEDEE